MMGCNEHGELGVNDYKEHVGVCSVKALTGKLISQVACGSGFTIAATHDHHVYTWGKGDCGELGNAIMKSQCIPRAIVVSHGIGLLFRSCPGSSREYPFEGRVCDYERLSYPHHASFKRFGFILK